MSLLYKIVPIFVFVIFLLIGWHYLRYAFLPTGPDDSDGQILGWSTDKYNTAQPTMSSFIDNFPTTSTLDETGNMKSSASKTWWLNSGGQFISGNSTGKTLQGSLPTISTWRVTYSLSNPTDTDNGYHPQNIFRLVTQTKWKNLTQQAYFKINADNLSTSPNRNASNGLFFFNRYLNGQNVYYTGLRVDGNVVIKKKINGTYYTMAIQKFLPGNYELNSSPNLIKKGSWIGLKSEVTTLADNNVEIKIYLDYQNSGNWTLALTAIDDGKKYGGATINKEGFAGIRTDFMDVEFSKYQVSEAK